MEAIQRIKHFPKLFVSSQQLYYPKSQMPELEEKHNHILQRGPKIIKENGNCRQNLVLRPKSAHFLFVLLCLQRFLLFWLLIFNSLFILSGSLLLSCFAMGNLSLFHLGAGQRGKEEAGVPKLSYSQWPKLSSLNNTRAQSEGAIWPWIFS